MHQLLIFEEKIVSFTCRYLYKNTIQGESMKRKLLMVICSGLLVNAGVFGKPDLYDDLAAVLRSLSAQSEQRGGALASARRAEIPGLAEIKAQTYSDLSGLPVDVKKAISDNMDRLAQLSPVIRSSLDGVAGQGKNLSRAATYQTLYDVIDGRVNALCPHDAGVRQATQRSLLGNLDASLNNMNGLDGKKMRDRRNFDISAIDEVILRHKSKGVLPDPNINDDAPPTYFEAIKVQAPSLVVNVQVAVHGAPPAYPGRK